MSQVHYEVFVRRQGVPGWTLDVATENRAKAMDAAEDLFDSGRAYAVKVVKETLDEETREFKSVTILTKGDVGGPDKKNPPKEIQPLCVTPQDLYTIHAREVIGRVLEGWLARERVTPFELLHRADLIEKLDAAGMDLQHAIQKIAIPEAQDRQCSVHEIIRHFQRLIQAAIERVLKDDKKSLFPTVEPATFAAACEKAMADGEPGYVLGGAVANAISQGATWSDKVGRLLDLADAAPSSPGPRALAFQILEVPLAEILGSRAGMAALLGVDLDLGGSLAAMTRLTAAETVDLIIAAEPNVAKVMPPLDGAAARLANWLESSKFETVRAALSQRVLHEIASPRRLRPADPEAEIDILRALAMCLTAAAGPRLPLELVQEAFTQRSKMLIRGDFVEAFLGADRTVLGEVEALVWLAENVTGAANKRASARWISANVGALRFERELRSSPDSPAVRLAALANLQKSVARVGFAPEDLAAIQAKIGEVGGLVEADSKLVALIVRANTPVIQRLTLLLRMAGGEAAPLGPAADRAKTEALKRTRSPDVRAEMAKDSAQVETMRGLLQGAGLAA